MRRFPILLRPRLWMLGLIVLTPWLLATPPLNPDNPDGAYPLREYRYELFGHLLRPDSTVSSLGIPVLLVRRLILGGDTIFAPIQTEVSKPTYPHEQTVSLTDSTGRFQIRVTTLQPINSLIVAVWHPDRAPVYYGPVPQLAGQRRPIVHHPTSTPPGCSCGAEPEVSDDTTGYVQTAMDLVIPIPY